MKLTAPVSVPLELDLSRFCTKYTGNPPVDELGQVSRHAGGEGIHIIIRNRLTRPEE